MRTMMPWLPIALALLVAAGCDDDGVIGPGPDEMATVSLMTPRFFHHVGDTVDVHVEIEDADNVGAVAFHLLYETEALQFIPPGTEGPFMSSDGSLTVFLAVDAAPGGDVVIGLARLGGGPGASGEGRLATFSFLALRRGPTRLTFAVASVRDPSSMVLPAEFDDAVVRVLP